MSATSCFAALPVLCANLSGVRLVSQANCLEGIVQLHKADIPAAARAFVNVTADLGAHFAGTSVSHVLLQPRSVYVSCEIASVIARAPMFSAVITA